MKNRLLVLIIIFVFTLVIFAPIIVSPDIFLNRGNDLTEFFWPIYYFTKEQILVNHTLPLWNNLFLSGTPLLPDPQAPFFYPPNIIFLVMPIGAAFIVSAFAHTFAGGLFTFLAARKGFKLSGSASVFAAFLYIASPRLAGYLEAGHFGLICAYAWLPLLVFSLLMLARKPSAVNSLIFAVSLAGLFYTHATTFVIAAVLAPLFLLAVAGIKKLKPVKFLVLGAVITFGLIAIAFLPQLSWAPYTNRYLLTSDRQVHPIWLSRPEFIKAMFIPWSNGFEATRNLETEKWITIGILPSLLAFIGFLKTKRADKILILVLAVTTALVSLNNLSPIYSFLLSQDWFVFARVATRIWFVIVLIVTFLGAYGFERMKTWSVKAAVIIAALALAEITFMSWGKVTKPLSPNLNLAPKEIYEFLASDHDRFRVFCTTRCLSQKTSAEYRLELVDGYSTLIQKNYNSHAWQMTGTYWNYYTLSIPPIGAYVNHEVRPDPVSLGEYNTKYIISPYLLSDRNFSSVRKIGGYTVYLNKAFRPRSVAQISIYSPNFIRIDTSGYNHKTLAISEVFSPGWKAYLNGKEPTKVQETPNALRSIDLTSETNFADFIYEPDNLKPGALITLVTLGISFAICLKKRRVIQSSFF